MGRFLAFWPADESASSSVRSVTDLFLLSGTDSEAAPEARPVNRNDDLALRSGLPQDILDIVPAQVVEDYVTRVESWAELVTSLRQTLQAAGLAQHDPHSTGGGFHIASHARDDGVLVTWATRQYTSHEPGSFENTVANIMQPALQAILAANGFAAEKVPEGDDDAGCILVTAMAPSFSRCQT
jgi:hypothetical protein